MDLFFNVNMHTAETRKTEVFAARKTPSNKSESFQGGIGRYIEQILYTSPKHYALNKKNLQHYNNFCMNKLEF